MKAAADALLGEVTKTYTCVLAYANIELSVIYTVVQSVSD